MTLSKSSQTQHPPLTERRRILLPKTKNQFRIPDSGRFLISELILLTPETKTELNMSRSIFSLFLLSFCNFVAKSTIVNVPADYITIQEAIDLASEHDTIVVAPGTYIENLNFKGKNLFLTSEFLWDQDYQKVLTTIIDGSQPVEPDTASCIIIIDEQDSTTVVQGFTITGGEGTAWKDEHSSGTYREGGGILVALSSPIIRNNLIVHNNAMNKTGLAGCGGGGIRCGDGKPQILNNVIVQNNGRYGGGIVMNWAGGTIRNNIIAGSEGGQDYGGGGLWLNKDNGFPNVIENNTIVDNYSSTNGGGIMIYNTPSQTIFRNNIIRENRASYSPQIAKPSSATFDAAYNDIEGELEGIGNIDEYPVFADTLFYLDESSPCIDAGDTSSVMQDPEDTGNPGSAVMPSKGNLHNDMGAYGGPGAMYLAPFQIFHVTTGKSKMDFVMSQPDVAVENSLIIYNGSSLPASISSIEIPNSLSGILEVQTELPLQIVPIDHDTLKFQVSTSAPEALQDTIRIHAGSGGDVTILKVVINLIIPEAASNIEKTNGLNLWPNPCKNDLCLKFEPLPSNSCIRVINSCGNIILNIPQNNGAEQTSLNLSFLPSGTYMIEILSENRFIGSSKLIKSNE
jgi:hypothetical protein